MNLQTVTYQTAFVDGVRQDGQLPTIATCQATTDANGLVTIPLVDEEGNAVFTAIWSAQATCVVSASANQNWPFATIKSIAADLKSLVVQTTHGTSVNVLLGGTIVSMAPAPNTPIHVQVIGT